MSYISSIHINTIKVDIWASRRHYTKNVAHDKLFLQECQQADIAFIRNEDDKLINFNAPVTSCFSKCNSSEMNFVAIKKNM